MLAATSDRPDAGFAKAGDSSTGLPTLVRRGVSPALVETPACQRGSGRFRARRSSAAARIRPTRWRAAPRSRSGRPLVSSTSSSLDLRSRPSSLCVSPTRIQLGLGLVRPDGRRRSRPGGPVVCPLSAAAPGRAPCSPQRDTRPGRLAPFMAVASQQRPLGFPKNDERLPTTSRSSCARHKGPGKGPGRRRAPKVGELWPRAFD